MKATPYLRESEKRAGRKAMVIEESINGIAYPLLGDTIVYLLAVQLAAGHMVLGYISSASYIAGIVLPLVPMVFNGRNQVRCQQFSWTVRALLSLGYLGVLFLPRTAALVTLLGTFTLFCVFRMIGISFNDFTIKSISSVQNRGRVVAEVNIAYQGSSVLFRFLTALLLRLRQFSTIGGMVLLQMAGVAANLVSAHFVGKIPCRSNVVWKKGHGVPWQLRRSLQDRVLRRRLLLRWITVMAMVVFNMSVPFLRVEAALSQSFVMLYSVCLGLAYVCAGIVTRDTADRLGSKPLVIFSSLLAAVCLAVWMSVPASLPPVAFFVLGFLTNFFLSSANMLCIRLVTQVMPDQESVSFNAMVNFAIAVFALAAGMSSGVLAGLHASPVPGSMGPGNAYSFVFLFAVLLSLVMFGISLRLEETGSFSTRDAAQVLFTLRGIQAVTTMDRLGKERDPLKRRGLLLHLGSNLNGLATGEMREMLANPFSPDAQDVLATLGARPRPALLGDVIRLARDDDSYLQINAIATLGSYQGNAEAVDVLLSLTEGHWSSVKSMACRSLARITGGDPRYLALVNRLSTGARHIEEEIDYLIAKRELDKEGWFYRDFFLAVRQRRSATFRQTRYAVLASFLLFGSPRLAGLYEMMNNGDVDDFLSGFLSDARDLDAIDRQYDAVTAMFEREDWGGVRSFCLGLLDEADVRWDSRFQHLKEGILEARDMDLSLFDVQDALAELYFCYSLAKNTKN